MACGVPALHLSTAEASSLLLWPGLNGQVALRSDSNQGTSWREGKLKVHLCQHGQGLRLQETRGGAGGRPPVDTGAGFTAYLGMLGSPALTTTIQSLRSAGLHFQVTMKPGKSEPGVWCVRVDSPAQQAEGRGCCEGLTVRAASPQKRKKKNIVLYIVNAQEACRAASLTSCLFFFLGERILTSVMKPR